MQACSCRTLYSRIIINILKKVIERVSILINSLSVCKRRPKAMKLTQKIKYI